MSVMDKNLRVFVTPLSGKQLQEVAFTLPDGLRADIIKLLGKPGDDAAMQTFLAFLEAELGSYVVLNRASQQQATQKERFEALKKLSSLSKGLIARLESLDDNNRFFLEQTLQQIKGMPGNPDTVSGVIKLKLTEETVQRLSFALDVQLKVQKPGVRRGPPVKAARQLLINALLRRYQECFGRWPSKSAAGPFEQALRLGLQSVGIYIEDLHSEIVDSFSRIKGE
jgi:hypothetical protein